MREFIEGIHGRDLSGLLLHQPVYIEPVGLIRRNPAGRCMRLYNIAHLFEVRHLIPYRRRAEIQIRVL